MRMGGVTDKVSIVGLMDGDWGTTTGLDNPLFEHATTLGPITFIALSGMAICSTNSTDPTQSCMWKMLHLSMRAVPEFDSSGRAIRIRHYAIDNGQEHLTYDVRYSDYDDHDVPHLITVTGHMWNVPGSQMERHSWKIKRLEAGEHLNMLTPEVLLGVVPNDRVTDYRFGVPAAYVAVDGRLKSYEETLALADATKRSLAVGQRMQQLSSEGQLVVPTANSPRAAVNLRSWLEWVRAHGLTIVGGAVALGGVFLVLVRRRRAT